MRNMLLDGDWAAGPIPAPISPSLMMVLSATLVAFTAAYKRAFRAPQGKEPGCRRYTNG
ncbi:MAG: hypothetical protein AAFQ17_03780 [Pseudomonadota bacterium]